jgi:hypothetical protein
MMVKEGGIGKEEIINFFIYLVLDVVGKPKVIVYLAAIAVGFGAFSHFFFITLGHL